MVKFFSFSDRVRRKKNPTLTDDIESTKNTYKEFPSYELTPAGQAWAKAIKKMHAARDNPTQENIEELLKPVRPF